ncbi:MAG: hypothetical protein J0H89_00950, partial [Rhizobiales bacterium]|nr:hypothetical protein [Hyphomicrobiales bacterium]
CRGVGVLAAGALWGVVEAGRRGACVPTPLAGGCGLPPATLAAGAGLGAGLGAGAEPERGAPLAGARWP